MQYRASTSPIYQSAPGENLDEDLARVSRYIDKRLGRFFTKDAAAVARTYMVRSRQASYGWAESENPWHYGPVSRVLYVDDLVSVSSILIDEDRDGSFADETGLATTEYELTPRNAALGPEAAPYTGIELTSWGTKVSWPANARVQVTGVWGWPSVPGSIISATIELTRILRMEGPRATSQINDIDQVLQASPAAQSIIYDLIRNYRRIAI